LSVFLLLFSDLCNLSKRQRFRVGIQQSTF